jgi:hypothetical protein
MYVRVPGASSHHRSADAPALRGVIISLARLAVGVPYFTFTLTLVEREVCAVSCPSCTISSQGILAVFCIAESSGIPEGGSSISSRI